MVYTLSLKSRYFFVYKNFQMSFTINNNMFCVDQILCEQNRDINWFATFYPLWFELENVSSLTVGSCAVSLAKFELIGSTNV